MFVITLLADTIRIPPHLLSQPTLNSVQTEIEKRYPNKIILDVGLIICPYGPPLEVGDGVLVPGDGGAHHQVLFQVVVFKPFVEEVLIGTVKESHEGGIVVSVGNYFDHVFIPAYWMLNPSKFDAESGLWVWSPKYDDDDDDDDEEEAKEKETGEGDGKGLVKQEENNDDDGDQKMSVIEEIVDKEEEDEEEEEENRFEIEIGSEIRFKVKSVNFTRITKTMKGVQATTTTTSHSSDRAFGLNGGSDSGGAGDSDGVADNSGSKPRSSSTDGGIIMSNTTNGGEGGDESTTNNGGAVRRRSSSADLSDSSSEKLPAPMQIVGSICEDGLGLTSWWNNAATEEEEEEEEEGGG